MMTHDRVEHHPRWMSDEPSYEAGQVPVRMGGFASNTMLALLAMVSPELRFECRKRETSASVRQPKCRK